MGCLGGGDDGGVGGEGEVDTGVGDQVGLELVQVNVKGAIESEGCSDAGNDLSDEPVEVGESGGGDSEGLFADVVDGLIVNHEGAVRVLERGVGGQNALRSKYEH